LLARLALLSGWCFLHDLLLELDLEGEYVLVLLLDLLTTLLLLDILLLHQLNGFLDGTTTLLDLRPLTGLSSLLKLALVLRQEGIWIVLPTQFLDQLDLGLQLLVALPSFEFGWLVTPDHPIDAFQVYNGEGMVRELMLL
jgi:hypothetical protein